MKKQDTVLMRFSKDQFYVTAANRQEELTKPKYLANQVYEIEISMVARWLKRGGDIVTEEQLAKELAQGPAKVEETPAEPVEETQEPAIETEEQVEPPEEKAEDETKSQNQASHKSHKGHKHKR